MVTIAELLALLPSLALYPFLADETFCVHGNESGETVATMNIHTLGNGTKTMCGIDIATVFLVILHAPV